MVGTYRRFTIRKRAGGKRSICAPDKPLVAYQRKHLARLEKIFTQYAEQEQVLDAYHGFLSYRSPVTAAELHIGYKATAMFDLTNFFDSVHKSLIPPLEELQDPNFYTREGYVAQGFASSPLLANIASVPLVRQLKDLLPNCCITIYADDISISFNDQTEQEVCTIVERLVEASPFQLNVSKTRVKYAKSGYRRILGVNVGDDHIRATRKTMRRIRAARHLREWSSLGGLTNWSQCPRPKRR